jgi:hypothetical protein
VNAIAFHPRITIDEKGKVEGVEGFAQLEAPDIFSQFVLNPCAFRDFVMERFEQTYSSLFVYQVEPVARLVNLTAPSIRLFPRISLIPFRIHHSRVCMLTAKHR